ncbi:uncharacterized protein LOC121763811 [Salvia splendens]|uniref:uncharacterized protein LOC121763811 n=1 Tax=Salvia splendens TaxID=180675 RepID=UPI001C25EBD5|nr:uncharacterized protein LOC121763811 [Salvia splendens]
MNLPQIYQLPSLYNLPFTNQFPNSTNNLERKEIERNREFKTPVLICGYLFNKVEEELAIEIDTEGFIKLLRFHDLSIEGYLRELRVESGKFKLKKLNEQG